MERESSKECSVSFLWTNESFSLWNCLSRSSTLFSTRGIGALGLFGTKQDSEASEDTRGTFFTLWSKKSTFLEENFCIYKGFMDMFLHFDISVKEKPKMCVWNWFFAMWSTDLTCVNATIYLLFNLCYAYCFLGLTYGFLNKIFQEIKLFICHCSFITLPQKTTMVLQIVRFLETFRRNLSWIKTEVLFLYMFRIELLFIFSFITCHSRILQCLEFKNFCSFVVCSVLLFFDNLCPMNTAEYRFNEVYCVCFQLFFYGFIYSLKK